MALKIKTNFAFPQGTDVQVQGQRMAQDLSNNFTYINNLLATVQSDISNYLTTNSGYTNNINGIPLSQSYTLTTSSLGVITVIHQNIAFTHNLGSVPSGYLVTSLGSTVSPTGSMSDPVVTFVSSDATYITLRVSVLYLNTVGGTTFTCSGNLNIIVLE